MLFILVTQVLIERFQVSAAKFKNSKILLVLLLQELKLNRNSYFVYTTPELLSQKSCSIQSVRYVHMTNTCCMYVVYKEM